MKKLPKHTVHVANFRSLNLQKKKIPYISIRNLIFKFSCSDKRAFQKLRKIDKYIYDDSFCFIMLWFKAQESFIASWGQVQKPMRWSYFPSQITYRGENLKTHAYEW